MHVICRCQTYRYDRHLHVSLFFRRDPKNINFGENMVKTVRKYFPGTVMIEQSLDIKAESGWLM